MAECERCKELREALRPFAEVGRFIAEGKTNEEWSLWVAAHSDSADNVKITQGNVLIAMTIYDDLAGLMRQEDCDNDTR